MKPRTDSKRKAENLATLLDLFVKFQQPQVTLNPDERICPSPKPDRVQVDLSPDECAWLSELLTAIVGGEDVSHRFVHPCVGRPRKDALHHWLALDVARLKHEGCNDPYAAAGERWRMDPDSVRRTLARKKEATVVVIDVRLIDWQRARLLPQK